MAHRDEIVAHLHEFLQAATVADYGPQGLQVEGAAEVTSVVTAVSCSLEVFERAAARGAQMVLVHHGLLWDRDPRRIVGVLRRRLKVLFDHDINLVAYHLPLDAHPEVGHSAVLAGDLGLVDREPFGDYRGLALGCRGRFDEPLPVAQVTALVERTCGRAPLVFGPTDRMLRTVAIASGGGADMAEAAVAAGLDCFITGEAREGTPAYCRETGLTFFEAGHYATEKPGIVALGERLAREFGLDVVFEDVPNPL